MKDSHVPWIGDVPEHWKVMKLKFLAEDGDSIKPGPFGSDLKTSDFVNDGFKIYNQKDILDSSFVEDLFVTEAKFKKLSSFHVQSGDLLLTSRGSIGKSTIVPETFSPGIIHPCLIRVRVNESKINKSYVNLIINESDMFKENIRINSNGTVIDVIYGKTLKEIIIPVPEIIEQISILKFLDVKIKTINIEISKNKDLIKLLQEQKQSVINHVVTKGLDDSVPTKESGVEWIGKIPEHWNLSKYSHVSTRITYGFTNPMPSSDKGPWLLTARDIKNGKINYDTSGKTDLDSYHFKLSEKSKPKINTVLITKDGTLGETAIVDSTPLCINQSIASIFPNSAIISEFLQFSLSTNYIKHCILSFSDITTMAHISITDLGKWKVCLPSLKEQKQIVDYLDKKTKKIDLLLSKVESQIKKLQEFRESLISSAVTGKIQVAQT